MTNKGLISRNRYNIRSSGKYVHCLVDFRKDIGGPLCGLDRRNNLFWFVLLKHLRLSFQQAWGEHTRTNVWSCVACKVASWPLSSRMFIVSSIWQSPLSVSPLKCGSNNRTQCPKDATGDAQETILSCDLNGIDPVLLDYCQSVS